MRPVGHRSSYLEDSSDEDSPLRQLSSAPGARNGAAPPQQAQRPIPRLSLGRSVVSDDEETVSSRQPAKASQPAPAKRTFARRRNSNTRPSQRESLLHPDSPEKSTGGAVKRSSPHTVLSGPEDSGSSSAGSSSGDSLGLGLRKAAGAAAAPEQRARRNSRLVDSRQPGQESQVTAVNDGTSSVASSATPPGGSALPRPSGGDGSANKTLEEQVQSLAQRCSELEEQMKQNESSWSHEQRVREVLREAERRQFQDEQQQLEHVIHNRLQMEREDERGHLQREVIWQVCHARNQLVRQGAGLVASSQKLAEENLHLEEKVRMQTSELEERQRHVAELREANDFSECRAALERSVASCRANLSCTERLLQEANVRLGQELQQRERLEEQLQRCQAEVEAKENAQSRTQRQCRELEQQVAPLRKQVADLRFELQEARRRVDSPAVAVTPQRADRQAALSIVNEASKGLTDRPLDFHFDRLSLDTLDHALFKKEFMQCLQKLGASPAVLLGLTLKLRKGSVIARLEGTEAAMRDLERLLQQGQVAVMGDVARVVQVAPGSIDGLKARAEKSSFEEGMAAWMRSNRCRSLKVLSGEDLGSQLKDCSPAERLSCLAQGSSAVVGALLQKIQRVSDARLATGGAASGSRLHIEKLKAVKALERQIAVLERSNHEWASALVERGSASHEWAANLTAVAADVAASLSRAPQEIATSPSECTAKLPSELQRSAHQLERLRARLKAMHEPSSSPATHGK
mmetsp:Transcript_162440/g.299753  ORF Transcript_162440/g.299753 Transcript_162440/m.299753 type:complete len:748 (-) Transcript_162440:88-2331(-)